MTVGVVRNCVLQKYGTIKYYIYAAVDIVRNNDTFTIIPLTSFLLFIVADEKTSTEPDIETEHSDIEGASVNTEKYYKSDEKAQVCSRPTTTN